MKFAIECISLDEMLEGGIENGALTELYGEAGSGKTNICLQLLRNAIRSGKKAVFIDTEGVSLERLRQICSDKNDFDNIYKGILFFEVYSLAEQDNAIRQAMRLVDGGVEIGLIVVDSATVYYRVGLGKDGELEGRRSLTEQIINLLNIARKKKIPIVITNQVYTDIDKKIFNSIGGQALKHIPEAIIKLEKIGIGKRRAVIEKHRSLREGLCTEFYLTEKGVA